jgi:hypothetical protein
MGRNYSIFNDIKRLDDKGIPLLILLKGFDSALFPLTPALSPMRRGSFLSGGEFE